MKDMGEFLEWRLQLPISAEISRRFVRESFYDVSASDRHFDGYSDGL
jgi:hypothetical protein